MSNNRSLIIFAFVSFFSSYLSAETMSLGEAYDLALKNEPHLKSLTLKTEAYKESVEQSKARLYPQVQGSLSWGRYEYDAEYLKAPVKENYDSYSISASQPLYHPELWRSVDESKASETAANEQLRGEVQKLGLDLAKAYFNVLKTESTVVLSKSKKDYYETKYKQLEEMLKFGLTNRIDLLEAKVASDKALSESLVEQKRLQVAILRLEHIIKQPFGELPSFDFTTVDLEQLFHDRSVWENKLSNNPNFKASVASEEMATHQVAIREYEHYPKVDLNINRKETYSQDPVSHKYDNQAIVQMSIPIYQGGYTQSRVREGAILLQSAQSDVEYNQLDTKLKFEEQWAESQMNIETLLTLKESEKSAVLYVESVDQGHKAGLKSLVDLLEAKSKLYEIRRDTIDAGYQLVNNYLTLLDVSGELTSENIKALENMMISQENKKSK
jgi:outer membrane protein